MCTLFRLLEVAVAVETWVGSLQCLVNCQRPCRLHRLCWAAVGLGLAPTGLAVVESHFTAEIPPGTSGRLSGRVPMVAALAVAEVMENGVELME